MKQKAELDAIKSMSRAGHAQILKDAEDMVRIQQENYKRLLGGKSQAALKTRKGKS